MFKRILFVCALTLATLSVSSASSFTYDGDAVPTDPPYTVVIFGGTSMNAAGGVLNLTTAASQGVWFGFQNSPYINNIGSSAEGNYVGIQTRLSPGAHDWSIYLNDGASSAGFGLNDDGYAYWYGANQSDSVALDLTTFHTFEFWLQGGNVAYAVDGVLRYSGAALASGNAKILVIGDGSGSTPTGTGSMQIDSAEIVTGPNYDGGAPPIPSDVPEPASVLISGCGLAVVGVLARRKRT